MVKVIRTDQELECPDIDDALHQLGVELVLLPDGVSEHDLVQESRDADLILMCYTPITAAVIGAAKTLKGIIKYGVGIDAIDIPAAMARRIPVVNIPEYAERTVAEGAFGLLIALAKRLVPMSREMQSQGWLWPTPTWLGTDIADKTVGLIGVGRIGRHMARITGAGFGARVLGYDPNVSAADTTAAGIEKFSDLHTMLPECDFVSIHCVLNDATRHLIGKAELDMMKPTSCLINVSRGAIVDEMALRDALARRPDCWCRSRRL